jgi:hypothetical protein
MHKRGKYIFIILLLWCISTTAFAQRHLQDNRNSRQFYRPHNPGGNRMPNSTGIKRLQVVKEGFITRRLLLTPEEGERFWPVYRQYQQEVIKVRRLKRLNNSDAQANGSEQIRKDLEYESQLVDIKKRYNDEFLRILPPEKVSQLYKSEREFTDEMIKQLHERNRPGD